MDRNSFLLITISWAFLLESWLNFIFHGKLHSLIFSRIWLRSLLKYHFLEEHKTKICDQQIICIYCWYHYFWTYTIHMFSNKKFTVARYLHIWTYLGSQSKSHYEIVDRKLDVRILRVICASFLTGKHLLANKKDKDSQ